MKDRIKKIRKELDLTQQKFADKIGMKQNTVATYEMGRAIPSDIAIKSICREFNVNESWLRTGEGKMFRHLSDDEGIHELVDNIMSSDDDFIKSIYRNLAKASPEFIDMLKEFVDNIYQDTHMTDTKE